MTSPTQMEFWQIERRMVWEFFNELLMDTMLAGASNGLPLLPAALRPLVSWDVINQSAITFLRNYRSDILDAIDAVSERQAREIIAEWARRGDPLSVLRNELRPIFGTNRARNIAATEVTRMFAKGNLMLWQSTGVVEGKVWQTARDERVCPFCGPLHGRVVEINSDFTITPDEMSRSPQMRALLGKGYTPEKAASRANALLKSSGMTSPHPPYHPGCRCWLKPVVSIELVEQRIDDILAQQFFAELQNGRYPHVAYSVTGE